MGMLRLILLPTSDRGLESPAQWSIQMDWLSFAHSTGFNVNCT